MSIATGGTFVLVYGGETTAELAYNATAAQVQSALAALTGLTNVIVKGGAGFALGYQCVTLPTGQSGDIEAISEFTGGTSPKLYVTEERAYVAADVEEEIDEVLRILRLYYTHTVAYPDLPEDDHGGMHL